MTQEEKNLLLKDLLPRLIYGVKIQTWYGEIITSDLNTFQIGYDEIDIEQLAATKPYLRSMSSMTKEERVEFSKLLDKRYCEEDWEGHVSTSYCIEIDSVYTDDENGIKFTSAFSMDAIDWLNEYHFDYRGLIEKGLALEASEGMYDIKHTKSEQEQIEELAELKEKLSK